MCVHVCVWGGGGRRMSVRIYVHVCVFIGCCLATKTLNLITQSGMGGGDNECGMGCYGNIHQISFGLMLYHLGQRREDMTSRQRREDTS